MLFKYINITCIIPIHQNDVTISGLDTWLPTLKLFANNVSTNQKKKNVYNDLVIEILILF